MPQDNKIVNGDFSQGTTGWGWTPGDPLFMHIDPTVQCGGIASLRIDPDSVCRTGSAQSPPCGDSASMWPTNRVQFNAGQHVVIRCFFKTGSGTGSARLGCDVYSGSLSFGGLAVVGPNKGFTLAELDSGTAMASGEFTPWIQLYPRLDNTIWVAFVEAYVLNQGENAPPARNIENIPSSCTVFRDTNGVMTYSCNTDIALVHPITGCAQKIVSQGYGEGIISLKVIGCEAKPSYWTTTIDVTTGQNSGWVIGDPVCSEGYHWDLDSLSCIADVVPPPPPHKSFAARTIGPLGIPSSVLRELWILREKLITDEVHKKLHPLV